MLSVQTQLKGVTLHEILHPMAPNSSLVYLTIDAARAGFGGWSLIQQEKKDSVECFLLFDGITHIIAVTIGDTAEAQLFACQIHETKEYEAWAASGAMLSVFNAALKA